MMEYAETPRMRTTYIPLLDDPEPLRVGQVTKGMRVCHPPSGECGTVRGFCAENGLPMVLFDGDAYAQPFKASDLVLGE